MFKERFAYAFEFEVGPLAGRAFGDGGIARPRRGVRGALPPLAPGIGGRSNGAGLDMAECEY